MRRLVATLAAAALVAGAGAGSAAAWHYTFQDFFDIKGNAVAAGVTKAKKCGPGGRLGSYDYRSFVNSSSGDTQLELGVTAELSVRHEWRRLKHVEVSSEASPDYPPEIIAETATALLEFHESVFTRYKHDKLKIRHGSLVVFGNEVVSPGQGATKFKPKPGC